MPSVRPFALPSAAAAALTGALLLSGLGGCLLSRDAGFADDEEARPATEAPDRFEPRNPEDRLEPADTLAGRGCLSPMVDPRTGLELRLIVSLGGRGDYHVPEGRYGVGPGELLRLVCNTGDVIGIVPR